MTAKLMLLRGFQKWRLGGIHLASTCLVSFVFHTTVGCLLPPPLEEVSLPRNSPPRILPQTLVPAPSSGPERVLQSCLEQAIFSASLTDPDGDTLYWRVFVDYFTSQADRSPAITEELVLPDVPSPISLNLEEAMFSSEVTHHTVELFVADRPFATGSVSLEGRILAEDEGLFDSFVWPVILDEDPAECSGGSG